MYPWRGGLTCGPVAQVMVHHAGGCNCTGEGVLEGHKRCGQRLALGSTLQHPLHTYWTLLKNSNAVWLECKMDLCRSGCQANSAAVGFSLYRMYSRNCLPNYRSCRAVLTKGMKLVTYELWPVSTFAPRTAATMSSGRTSKPAC